MYPDYLIHYGVKGMKWGVRKKYEKAYKQYKKALASSQRYQIYKMNLDNYDKVSAAKGPIGYARSRTGARADQGRYLKSLRSKAIRDLDKGRKMVSKLLDDHPELATIPFDDVLKGS